MMSFSPSPVIPANRASELLDELLFCRVLEHIDVAGLQRMEAELWTTLIDLDVDLGGRSPMVQARALISRALQRFIDDPTRVASVAACGRGAVAATVAASGRGAGAATGVATVAASGRGAGAATGRGTAG